MITNFIQKVDEFGLNQPDKVVFESSYPTEKKNTYGELLEYSNNLASYIDKLGIDRSQPILVYGNQTFETIATFLGVVKSGHAYIPIDSHSPNERIMMINDIAKPGVMITVESLDLNLPDLFTVTPDMLAQVFNTPTDYHVDHEVKDDETYYIIFTSGTTGKPKGVQISHKNLLSFVNWMLSDEFKLPDSPRSLSQPPYSFDLSVMDWGPTLASGGTLVALSKEETDNFKTLFEVLPKTNIQVWVSTPSFMDICLLNPAFNADSMPNITHFLFCGEELTHKTAATLRKRFPKARIFNTYGPTETTVAVTQVEITDDILAKYDRLPIGKPKPDTSMTIVDPESGKPVLESQKGELLIQGPSVSKGYINNPEKTKAAFIDKTPRQYRSGDLCARDSNGQILFYGRTDFQIKLHGYRIELEEVDFHLSHQKMIKQGVAVPLYDKDHKVSQLIAWVVPTTPVDGNDSKLDLTEKIKSGLKEEMLAYMIPNRIVFKDSLPQTANGKIDVKSIVKEVNS